MTARELPMSEWNRLSDTYQSQIMPILTDRCRVIVVEDAKGRIVAGWTLMPVVHAECLFVDEGQKHAMLPLLREVRRVAESMGVSHFVSGTDTPSVIEMIEDFKGTEVLARHFVVPVAELPESRVH